MHAFHTKFIFITHLLMKLTVMAVTLCLRSWILWNKRGGCCYFDFYRNIYFIQWPTVALVLRLSTNTVYPATISYIQMMLERSDRLSNIH